MPHDRDPADMEWPSPPAWLDLAGLKHLLVSLVRPARPLPLSFFAEHRTSCSLYFLFQNAPAASTAEQAVGADEATRRRCTAGQEIIAHLKCAAALLATNSPSFPHAAAGGAKKVHASCMIGRNACRPPCLARQLAVR